jgi:pimeloyl-ACP methyl ester carboxylesterase
MDRQMAAVLSASDREPALRSLDVPTLVLHGTDDRLIGLDGGARLAELIPDAEFVELDDMGHDLPPHYWAPIIEAVTQLAIRSL